MRPNLPHVISEYYLAFFNALAKADFLATVAYLSLSRTSKVIPDTELTPAFANPSMISATFLWSLLMPLIVIEREM